MAAHFSGVCDQGGYVQSPGWFYGAPLKGNLPPECLLLIKGDQVAACFSFPLSCSSFPV